MALINSGVEINGVVKELLVNHKTLGPTKWDGDCLTRAVLDSLRQATRDGLSQLIDETRKTRLVLDRIDRRLRIEGRKLR